MKPLFPFVKNISAKTIAGDLISVRPDEKWEDAVKRFIMEKRMKKINKILKRKGSD